MSVVEKWKWKYYHMNFMSVTPCPCLKHILHNIYLIRIPSNGTLIICISYFMKKIVYLYHQYRNIGLQNKCNIIWYGSVKCTDLWWVIYVGKKGAE